MISHPESLNNKTSTSHLKSQPCQRKQQKHLHRRRFPYLCEQWTNVRSQSKLGKALQRSPRVGHGGLQQELGELVLATVPSSPPSPGLLCGRIRTATAVAGCSVARTSLKAAPAVCAYVGGLSQQPV